MLTRRVSQTLGLRSDSSAVSERGADPNGTTNAALKALELILELCGGEVASKLMEGSQVLPWTVEMSHEKMESVLGIKVEPKKVAEIFESLELKVTGKYQVTIPTFRNDLHIEEDLIEEVGRIIGYNSFPKTLPNAAVPVTPVAYSYDYDFDYEIKQTLKGAGYCEIYTYSLVSQEQLNKLGLVALRILNPISKEYEYLRPSLLGNLLEAYKLNQKTPNVKLFEMGKQYQDKETVWLWAVSSQDFLSSKGDLEKVLESSQIDYKLEPSALPFLHPARQAQIPGNLGLIGELPPNLQVKFGLKDKVVVWAINMEVLKKLSNKNKKYRPVSSYPPIIEDVTLALPQNILVGTVMDTIKSVSHLVTEVSLVATLENKYTFRIFYLDITKTLTEKEVAAIREKILAKLKSSLGVSSPKAH